LKNLTSFFSIHYFLPFVERKTLLAKSCEIEHIYEKDTTIAMLKQVRELPTIAPLGPSNPICGA
jgi:hypothetical protein